MLICCIEPDSKKTGFAMNSNYFKVRSDSWSSLLPVLLQSSSMLHARGSHSPSAPKRINFPETHPTRGIFNSIPMCFHVYIHKTSAASSPNSSLASSFLSLYRKGILCRRERGRAPCPEVAQPPPMYVLHFIQM